MSSMLRAPIEELMKKTALLCLFAPMKAFCASYFTSFENVFTPGDTWAGGNTMAYAQNGWAVPAVTDPNGFNATFLNGYQAGGVQSAQCKITTANALTTYASKTWAVAFPKKGFVSAWVRLNSGAAEGNPVEPGRGFGLEINDWRIFLYNNAGTYELWRRNKASGVSGKVPGSGPIFTAQWYQLGMGIDVSSAAPNSGKLRLFLNGSLVLTESFTADPGEHLSSAAKMMARNETGQNLKGTAHFDDFYMNDQVVPEPSTVGALAVGSLALVLGRRRARR